MKNGVGGSPKVSHTANVLLARSLLLFCVWGLSSPLRAEGTSLPRLRASRLISLVDATGTPLKGDCFSPHFGKRGNGIFFERNGQNTREMWFAAPIRSNERYPVWRAVPILRPKAPLALSEAISLQDDNTLFAAVGTNQSGSAPDTQLLLVAAKNSVFLKPLWKGRERMAHLALSPDALTLVFTRYFRDRKGHETPQLWCINPNENQSKPRLILKSARRAFWLDSSTLVFERLLGDRTAFYSLNPSASAPPRLLLQGSGEGTALAAGAGLVFAAHSSATSPTSLYLLARDGSGLRSIADSDGARHPATSNDGTRLAFDAPNPKTGVRSLWLLTLDPPESATPAHPVSFPWPTGKRTPVACQVAPMPLPPSASLTLQDPDTSSQQSIPTPLPIPTPAPKPTNVPSPPGDDRADIDVAGTLASVASGGKMRVTLWAKNRGKRNWTPDDVRIVVRWVDFDSGTRRRWSFNWMRSIVPPLGQIRVPLDIVAPTRKGRYKIIYSLIRLPSKGAQVSPPPFDAPQSVWPGEFAATAFAVNVNGPLNPT